MIISPSIESYFVGLGLNLQCPFNPRLMISYFVFISGTFSGFVQLFHVSETFQEYAQSYFATAAVTAAGLSFAIVASKIQKLSLFIHDLERIKKWDRLVNLFVMRISLHGAMWSKYIASFAIYFATDLGRDSFALPFPMW